MKRLIACLLALLPSIAIAQEPDSHKLLKAAAIGIVSNANCGGTIFDDVMIVSWIYSGRVENNMTEDEAIGVTKVYVAAILESIKTRQQLNEFCNAMFKITGAPT